MPWAVARPPGTPAVGSRGRGGGRAPRGASTNGLRSGRGRGRARVERDEAVLGRDPVRRDAIWDKATRALQISPIAGMEAAWREGASPAERALAAGRRDEVERRVRDATDPGRLDSAVNWLIRYKSQVPNLIFLRTRGGPDDQAVVAYNQRQLADLELFIREHGSVQPGHVGERLTQQTISGYVGALKACATILMGTEVVPEGEGRLLSRLGKQMRLEEAPSIERKLRRALRRDRLDELVRASFDITSQHGLTRWGAIRLGIACLLRPGEVGATSSNAFVPKRDLHWGKDSITWHEAGEAGWTAPFLTLWVTPIKNQSGKSKRIPIPVGALHPEGVSDDPRCPYSVVAKMWWRDARHLTEEQRARTAIFRHESGRVWGSDDVNAAVKEVVVALGLPAEEYGGVTLRITGATELRDSLGRAGKDVINSFGRWSDEDIGFIYQRVTAAEQLEAMASALGSARPVRPEMETVYQGWSQPAYRR